jgi:hypothetical protein
MTLPEIEKLEFTLTDLVWKLPQGRRRDDCSKALAQLRITKAGLAAGTDTLSKRGRAGDQSLKNVAHDLVSSLTDGEACRTGKAGGRHSGTVNAELHAAHHALVNAGASCDGGMKETAASTFAFEDKKSAARAVSLAKRFGTPVPIPARRARFWWEAAGTQAGLDEIERTAEHARINRHRATQGLVPLQ